MLYVLSGEDDFSLRQALEEIKRGIGDQAAMAANTATLDGGVTLDKLRGACETVPFLAEKRLVIIEGLLEHFDPRGKSGKKARSTDQKDNYKSMAAYLTQVPDFTILVLIDGRLSSRNPLLGELSAKAKVKLFPSIRGTQLHQWIERRVTGAGASISPQAIDSLTKFVGSNLWIMSNEIDKLVLFAAGRRIEEDDVKAVVSSTQEANVFAMVDAILEFKADVAQQLLQKLLQWGAAPAYLLVMLSRQAQMIVRIKELKNQGKSKKEIQDRLGLASEFVLRKTLAQADRYSPGRLRQLYHRLLEADLSIKTGKCDGELALNILVAELGSRSPASTN